MTKRIIATVLLLTASLLLVRPSHSTTTTLTGTIKDAQGNPLNGKIVLQLPVPAQDTTTNTAVANTPVTYTIVNGSILSGSSVPLYDVANLQPQNLYYSARVYDSSGTLVFTGNYAVTGASYNLGAAVPTNVTTSNISFVAPAVTNASNTFCCTQTFSGQISSTVATGTAPFLVQSQTAVPLLNVQYINGTSITGIATPGTVLTGGSGTATWVSQAPNVQVVSAVNLTAQQANIAQTSMVTPANNGFYRISCYIVLTQIATTSSTLPSCNVNWSDGDTIVGESSQLTQTSNANVAGTTGILTTAGALPFFFVKQGIGINYSTASYASVGATPMQYALHIRLEGPF